MIKNPKLKTIHKHDIATSIKEIISRNQAVDVQTVTSISSYSYHVPDTLMGYLLDHDAK